MIPIEEFFKHKFGYFNPSMLKLRRTEFVSVRTAWSYVAKFDFNYTYTYIGEVFNLDHSTIIQNIKNKSYETDKIIEDLRYYIKQKYKPTSEQLTNKLRNAGIC